MSQMMNLAGVPIAVGLSVAFAVGVELALIGSFIRLMARAAAQLEEDCPGMKSRKNPVR
jgi:hypothetical protein